MNRLTLLTAFLLITVILGPCTTQAQSSAAKVDLIWEADTYVPPMFEDVKPLITPSSRVRVVAIPNIYSGGDKVSVSNLFFEWTYNGRRLPDHSGYGQDILILPSVTNRDRVNLVIKNRQGNTVASNYVILPQSSVTLNMYAVSPLLGTQRRALGDRITSDSTSVELRAIPFYVPQDLQNVVWRVGNNVAYGENVVLLNDEKEFQAIAQFNDLILGDYSKKILIQFR